MNRAALADLVASLDPAERSMLAATIRTGIGALQTIRSNNGATFDPAVANALLAALAHPEIERQRSLSGQDDVRWVTITDVTRNGVPSCGLVTPAGSTLRRWAGSGQVRARRAGRDWLLDLDDLERKLRKGNR